MNGQYDNLIIELGLIIKVLTDRGDATQALKWAYSVELSASLDANWHLTNQLSADQQLEDRLIMQLHGLLEELQKLPVQSTDVVLIGRRTLATAFRSMKRFADAETYDRFNTGSIIALSVLAGDIFSQNDPSRRQEVIDLYLQALDAGYGELTSTIWPCDVRAERGSTYLAIGGTYLALANVFVSFGEVEEAAAQIDALISLNDASVQQIKNSGLPFVLAEAYKLLVGLAQSECGKGNEAFSVRLLAAAFSAATRTLNQSGNLKTVACLLGPASGKTD